MQYHIKATRQFFGPKTKISLVLDEATGNAASFATPAAARQHIAALESGIYYKADAEVGRPDYAVVRADKIPQYLKAYL